MSVNFSRFAISLYLKVAVWDRDWNAAINIMLERLEGAREKLEMYEITLSVPEETLQALQTTPENLQARNAVGGSR